MPEIVLAAIVVWGFVLLVLDFAANGRLPQPFVYDVSDTFMDWFNTAFWAHRPGAFTVWRTVYPPISFVFLKIFGFSACYLDSPYAARDCDKLGLAAIAVSYFACVAVSAVAFYRCDPQRALLRTVAFALGLPLLYTLERGNLILVGFVFFALAYGDLVKSRFAVALNAAVAINFKPYLVIPIVAVAIRRDWRTLEIAGLMTLIVYMASWAILGEGDMLTLAGNISDWTVNTGALVYEQIYYSTSYAPFLGLDSDKFPTRDFVGSVLVENISYFVPRVILISQLLGIATLAAAWLQPEAVTRPPHLRADPDALSADRQSRGVCVGFRCVPAIPRTMAAYRPSRRNNLGIRHVLSLRSQHCDLHSGAGQ